MKTITIPDEDYPALLWGLQLGLAIALENPNSNTQELSERLTRVNQSVIDQCGFPGQPTREMNQSSITDIAEDLKRRVAQLSFNQGWLMGKIDEIHDALCPGKIGTWQDRADQAVTAAKTAAVILRNTAP